MADWNYDYRVLHANLDPRTDYWDGDTVTCVLDDGVRRTWTIRIRLGDIDTWEVTKRGVPEEGELADEHKRRGKLAKEAVRDWFLTHLPLGVVWVRSMSIREFDSFGRLLGAFHCSHDGHASPTDSLAEFLRAGGHEKRALTMADLPEV